MWGVSFTDKRGEKEIRYKKLKNSKGRLRGGAFAVKANHKMGGVSIISGTLASVSGAFPTFAVCFIIPLV